jgi:ribonuclease HII
MSERQIALLDECTGPLAVGALEEESFCRGFKRVAGLDEVGRGPLAGPVVAAAVVFPRGFSHPEIKDSKALTAAQREELVPIIKESSIGWGIGIVDVEEIDRRNILNASLLAMVAALKALRPRPDYVLIDGNQLIPGELFQAKRISLKGAPQQRTVIKGDRLCFSIAAASILAKVARDRIMMKLDKRHPQYGFAHHKGYSSAEHLEALRRFGPSPVHRRSFKPVRDACPDAAEQNLPLLVLTGSS